MILLSTWSNLIDNWLSIANTEIHYRLTAILAGFTNWDGVGWS